ncbi:DUF2207 domain-containing protein [Caproiciproducens faecalis]|uniref:DUF2207 domain-containing protein n=1 Tax=Caproiciproducens faecalis TaxID=2820301 RepID=A0ABS7DQE8_9FIRM|nr:DUF2207 domain-containing protein [Caproiciproducens faecalis]MBW7573520.1 DUF2207 domain-containing protein [Caproiciproducens faecalis]
MAKKLFGGMAAAVAAILLVLFIIGSSADGYKHGAKQTLENLDIVSQLSSNGDMQVTETWHINLEGRGKPYSNLYKTFPVNEKQASGIENLSVYDMDENVKYSFRDDVNPTSGYFSEDNVCYIYNTAQDTEIGWFMPSIESGVRNFRVSYTIKNLVAVYGDTSVLYNAFIGNKFSIPITQLHGTISLPAGAKDKEVKGWLHCTAQSQLTVNSPTQITFTANKVPPETLVETRVCMPVSLFPASTRISTANVLSDIEKEEQKWADEWAEKQRMNYIIGVVDAVAGVVLVIAGIFILIWLKKKAKPYQVDAPEYTREIPEGSSPGGAANLFYYYSGGVTSKEEGRVFSATLMSLARKGYVGFDSSEKKEFMVNILGNTKQLPLTQSEQTFYDMIATVASSYGDRFTMKQFEKYAKDHSKYIDSSMENFLSQTKREIAARGYYEHRPSFLTGSSLLGILSIAGAVAILLLTGGWLVYIPLGFLIFGILLLVAASGKTRLSAKGEYDYAVWHGLEKYMLEFSRMKEYGVPELTLWEEYLVYATMMGISKKVCDQLKMVYPQLNDDGYLYTNYGGSYMYYMFGRSVGMGGFSHIGSDFGSVLGSTISNISTSATRLAHPPQSSGGSGGFGGGGFGGGGFGGGGGGFGGGGGGGAR